MSKPEPKKTHVLHQWRHTSPLITCRFDPRGRYLLTSAQDMGVQRWQYPSGKKDQLNGHDSWVRDIAFLENGQTMITVGSDERMIVWSLDDEQPVMLQSIQAHKGWLRAVAVSPDGQLIATGGNDKRINLWNAGDRSLIGQLAGHQSDVYSLQFHPKGEFLLSGDLAGKVLQWDVTQKKPMGSFDAKDLHTYSSGQRVHYGGVRSIAFSPDGKHLACSGLHKATNPLGAVNDPLVVVFDWSSRRKLRSHVASGVQGIAWRVAYLSDGTLIACSGGRGGGYLLFWNVDQEKEFHKLKLSNTARGLDLHPDGLHVATAHFDGHVRISRLSAKVPA